MKHQLKCMSAHSFCSWLNYRLNDGTKNAFKIDGFPSHEHITLALDQMAAVKRKTKRFKMYMFLIFQGAENLSIQHISFYN